MLLPTQLNDLLALAAATGIVTQLAKWVARQFDPQFGGKGSLVLSGAVGVLLAALSYGAGWAHFTPIPAGADIFVITQVVLQNALAATLLANAAYIKVYAQTFATPEEGPAE